jgi:hypothetical protein
MPRMLVANFFGVKNNLSLTGMSVYVIENAIAGERGIAFDISS